MTPRPIPDCCGPANTVDFSSGYRPRAFSSLDKCVPASTWTRPIPAARLRRRPFPNRGPVGRLVCRSLCRCSRRERSAQGRLGIESGRQRRSNESKRHRRIPRPARARREKKPIQTMRLDNPAGSVASTELRRLPPLLPTVPRTGETTRPCPSADRQTSGAPAKPLSPRRTKRPFQRFPTARQGPTATPSCPPPTPCRVAQRL